MAKRSRRTFGSIEERPSTIPGRRPRYRALYVGPDGKRYRGPRTYDLEGDAAGFLRVVLRAINAGTWTPLTGWPDDPATRPTLLLADWLEQVIVARETRTVRPIKTGTAYGYRKHADVLTEALPPLLADVTPEHVTAWYAREGRRAPTQTANAYLFLASALDDAVTAGHIDANPCQIAGARGKPKPKRETESLTIDELHAYMAAVKRPEFRLALMLCATCSLRSGEVRALRRRSVEVTTGRIHVTESVTETEAGFHFDDTKSAAGARIVYAPAFLVPSLAEHVALLPRGRAQLLFPSVGDPATAMRSSTLWRAHTWARHQIGRDTLQVHDLRRTAATLAAQQGATVRELMQLLGHTTPQMAMRYQVASEQRMREISGRLDAAWTPADPAPAGQ